MATNVAPNPALIRDGHHSDELILGLERRARSLRRNVIDCIHAVGAGHAGGCLSSADIMTALYFHQMRVDPAQPDWPDRDRLILSKGHAAIILYSCLAQLGYFPVEELHTEAKIGSRLQGHPDRNKTPGVDMSSGMLGHGLTIGIGLALGARLRGKPYRIYVVLGDGETQGGVVWEGALQAPNFRLDNLTAILDYNGWQIDGPVNAVMSLEPILDKWRAFGWHVIEIDGHNMRQVLDALDAAQKIHGKPTIIVANTIKGKGVSFLENQQRSHYCGIDDQQFKQAMADLADPEVSNG